MKTVFSDYHFVQFPGSTKKLVHALMFLLVHSVRVALHLQWDLKVGLEKRRETNMHHCLFQVKDGADVVVGARRRNGQ